MVVWWPFHFQTQSAHLNTRLVLEPEMSANMFSMMNIVHWGFNVFELRIQFFSDWFVKPQYPRLILCSSEFVPPYTESYLGLAKNWYSYSTVHKPYPKPGFTPINKYFYFFFLSNFDLWASLGDWEEGGGALGALALPLAFDTVKVRYLDNRYPENLDIRPYLSLDIEHKSRHLCS
jgi:hypothetical protein